MMVWGSHRRAVKIRFSFRNQSVLVVLQDNFVSQSIGFLSIGLFLYQLMRILFSQRCLDIVCNWRKWTSDLNWWSPEVQNISLTCLTAQCRAYLHFTSREPIHNMSSEQLSFSVSPWALSSDWMMNIVANVHRSLTQLKSIWSAITLREVILHV